MDHSGSLCINEGKKLLAKKSGKVEDWEQYKRLRNQVKQRLRKEKLHYFEGFIEQSARNPRKTWKEVNRLFGSRYKCGIDTLRGEEGVLTDHSDIAEEFGRYFSSIVGVLEEGNGCIVAGGLRTAAPGISHSLTSLFSASLKCGKLPTKWKSDNSNADGG